VGTDCLLRKAIRRQGDGRPFRIIGHSCPSQRPFFSGGGRKCHGRDDPSNRGIITPARGAGLAIPEQVAHDSGMMPPTDSEIIPPTVPR
jgi:hypothetical protein